MSKSTEERLFDKLDEMDKRLDRIDITLEKNTYSLEIHEKRTTVSEQRLAHIERHVFFVNAVGKVALFLAGFAGFALTIIQIIKSI